MWFVQPAPKFKVQTSRAASMPVADSFVQPAPKWKAPPSWGPSKPVADSFPKRLRSETATGQPSEAAVFRNRSWPMPSKSVRDDLAKMRRLQSGEHEQASATKPVSDSFSQRYRQASATKPVFDNLDSCSSASAAANRTSKSVVDNLAKRRRLQSGEQEQASATKVISVIDTSDPNWRPYRPLVLVGGTWIRNDLDDSNEDL